MENTQPSDAGGYWWHLGSTAMQAASDFVRAVWQVREFITVVPAPMLADYFRRNPDETNGDEELAEHIDAACDALEGLPRAVLYGEAPSQYSGDIEEFLEDATRVLQSVTGRLQRIAPQWRPVGAAAPSRQVNPRAEAPPTTRYKIVHGMTEADDTLVGVVTVKDGLLVKVEYPDSPTPPDPNTDPLAWGLQMNWTLDQLLSYMESYVAVPVDGND